MQVLWLNIILLEYTNGDKICDNDYGIIKQLSMKYE